MSTYTKLEQSCMIETDLLQSLFHLQTVNSEYLWKTGAILYYSSRLAPVLISLQIYWTSGNTPGDSVTMGAGHPGTISLCRLRVSVSQSADIPHIHRLSIHLLLRFPWCCRLWRWIWSRGWCRSAASCACQYKNPTVWTLLRYCPGGLHHMH